MTPMNQTVKTVLIVAAVLLAIWVGSYLLDALGTHYG